MENQEKNSQIANEVLEKIKSGKIKMRPKFYFVLKTILIVAAVFVLAILIIFLISFIKFHMRASGIWYLPDFGFRGWGTYLGLLPWFLILAGLILILILEILAKRFSFVWKRPVVYSLLAIVLIVAIGGFIVEKTPLHPTLLLKARQQKLPFAGPMYRGFGMPMLHDVQRGVVEETLENGFKIRTFDDRLLTVILKEETQFPFGKEIEKGDTIVVMGRREDDTIRAFGIREIEDQFNVFERPPRHLPLPPPLFH
jgi:hypothetical protein